MEEHPTTKVEHSQIIEINIEDSFYNDLDATHVTPEVASILVSEFKRVNRLCTKIFTENL